MVSSRPAMRKLGWAITGLVILGAPLLGGTADRPYTLLCAMLCAGAAICTTLAWGARLRVSWFHLFFVVALAATLLQAVPIPPALRAGLSPGSHGDLRQLVAGFDPDAHRRFFALSLDVGATLHEAVRLAGYLCLLIALTGLLRSERSRGRLLGLIIFAASLVAGMGLLAGLGLTLPAPLEVPQGTTRALFPASLYNSNHMATLMGLGALLSLAAAQHAQRRQTAGPKLQLQLAGLYGLFGLCNLVLIGTLSRAGILVWLAAQALWLFAQRRRRRGLGRAGVLVLLAILVAVSQWPAAFEALRLRFSAAGLHELTAPGGKVHAWVEAWPLLRGHLAFGVGRGAFENAFQHVQGLAGQLRFAYLENEWLQIIVDWGMPTAAGLCVLLGLGFVDAKRGVTRHDLDGEHDESGPARAAIVGLFAIAVHNLFDFNLEIGGVAVAAVGLLALCQRPRPQFELPRWPLFALALCTIVGAGLVWTRFPSHDEDGARLRALCERPDVSIDEILTSGRTLALRHPFDAYLPALVAARLHADAKPDQQAEAVRWVNRALLANPREILARHIGASILIESGHQDQGLLLLRGAISDADAGQRRALLRTLRDVHPAPDALLATLPDAPAIEAFLDLLGQTAPPPWPLLRELSTRLLSAPCEPQTAVATWLGRAALALRDAPAAETAAEALLRDSAYTPALLFADLCDLLGDANRADAATGLLRKALLRGERAETLLALARLLERGGARDEARTLLDRALGRAEEPAVMARIHEIYADLETHADNPFQAATHAREAARLRYLK